MKNNKKIVIIDYGLGNLYSITKALEFLGFNNAIISNNKDIILSADGIILPGVGAFSAGMQGLVEKGLVEVLKEFVSTDKPVLGICLGAQIMMSKGYEFGEHAGLNFVEGVVETFPKSVSLVEKIPHVGWNGVYGNNNWTDSVFNDVEKNSNFYFTHSYIMKPADPKYVFAMTKYGNYEFCSVIKKGNVYGTQFHPEKSGEVGLKVIKNFISVI